jgi:hypothetical protein
VSPTANNGRKRIVATYDYRAEADGPLLYQTVRYDPKDFRQRRPDGNGRWLWNLDGMQRVLYRRPELLATNKGRVVFVCEGEKDCDALWALDVPATTNPMGAGKWLAEYAEDLRGRIVVIPPDNDAAGRKHAEQVARSLVGVAASVRILHLPGLPDKGDVSDWLAVPGNDKLKLLELADTAPVVSDRSPRTPGSVTPKRSPELPSYRPFPVEALPAPMAEYVRQGAVALGCEPAYLALPALAVAAGLIGYTRVLRLKRTWRVSCVLWTLVVADSGSLKTPAFRQAADYLFELQRRLDLEFKKEQADFARRKEEWGAAVKAAKDSGAQPPGEEPDPPTRRTVFTSDATIEAIAELIGDNPRGLLVACDELAAWLGSFARYKGKGAASDLQRWLSMHSAGGFAYHRRTGDRRRIVVPHAAVSVCGGIQPGILARAIGDEFLAAGLAARLLLAWPPRPVKVWTEVEVAPGVEGAYRGLLDNLLALDFGRDGTGQPIPHALILSPEAKEAWTRWYGEWAREQAAAEGELAAALAKLEEAAARFALLHHTVGAVGRGEDDRGPVGVESVEAGVTLARWFAGEARRIYASLSESEEERATRRLVEFVRARGGRTTVKELQRSNSRKYPSAAAAEADLEDLVRDGLARWESRPVTGVGGRPTRDCVLIAVPSDETDETHDRGTRAPSDETPDERRRNPENPERGADSSVSSVVGNESNGASAARRRGKGFVGPGGVWSECEQPIRTPWDREPGEEG